MEHSGRCIANVPVTVIKHYGRASEGEDSAHRGGEVKPREQGQRDHSSSAQEA